MKKIELRHLCIAATLALMVWATAIWAAWQDEASLSAPASDDEVLVKDTSDTTDDAVGTVKRMELQYLIDALLKMLSDGDEMRLSTTTDGHSWCMQIYDVDGTEWVDALCFENANTPTILLGTGVQMSGMYIDLPALEPDELTDTSSPHDLAEVELKGTTLSNSGASGASVYNFPARTEGWNFIFQIEAAQNVSLTPNGTEAYYLNGTQQSAGEAIVNESPTIGESIFCFSTGDAVYCESKYTDWVGDDD